MIWTASTTCEDGCDETLLGSNTHDERVDERYGRYLDDFYTSLMAVLK
jgi:hypothetical protein